MVYTNADGLKLRFGTDKAKRALVGAPADSGEYKTLIAELDANRLPAFGTRTALDDLNSSAIPAGAHIVSATLEVTEAFVGATGTLTIGTQQNDGTAIDEDGIDAAIAVTAIDAIGDTIACDGAVVGSNITLDSYLTVTVGTATFTAGQAKLVIKYFVPETITA